MRQFALLLCVFSFSAALADHDGTKGHSYNGRTFQCDGFAETKEFAETLGGGGRYFNFALCQLHRGHLDPGIETLNQAASMGDHTAAIVIAAYYVSNGYDLSDGKVTQEEANLQEAINYREMALETIVPETIILLMIPMEMDFKIEKEDHLYLKTASSLTKIT